MSSHGIPKFLKACLVLLVGLSWISPAKAVDVPANLIVNAGGMEWAWASPCAPFAPSCGNDLVMHDGWQIATGADFLASFTGFADLIAQFGGANNPICASAFFNSGHSHCDGVNVDPAQQNVAVWNAPAAWGANAQANHSETFVVRTADVPEPETMALLAFGLIAAGVARRRRQR